MSDRNQDRVDRARDRTYRARDRSDRARIGLMELGIGLRINNARRTVLARVSGLIKVTDKWAQQHKKEEQIQFCNCRPLGFTRKLLIKGRPQDSKSRDNGIAYARMMFQTPETKLFSPFGEVFKSVGWLVGRLVGNANV